MIDNSTEYLNQLSLCLFINKQLQRSLSQTNENLPVGLTREK